MASMITSATGPASASSSGALTSSTTRGSPWSAVVKTRSILDTRRDRGACCRTAPVRRVARRGSRSGGGLLLKLWCDARVDLGGRWYIIGVLNAREVREGRGAGEEGTHVAASGELEADQPSVLQLRVRILEMSSVFAELSDGAIRVLARRMQAVTLAPGDTLRLGGTCGDVVMFLASGVAEQSITDASGKLLLTRRPAPGDLLILPAPRTGDRYVTSIRGLSKSILLTLDRDGLLAGLGPDADKVVIALDKLWDQQVAAAIETQAQSAS